MHFNLTHYWSRVPCPLMQNPRMAWAGRDFKDDLIPSPCHGPLGHCLCDSVVHPCLESVLVSSDIFY